MKRLIDTASGDLFANDIERPGALGCQVEIAACMAVAMEKARERGLTRERIAERMTYLLGEKISKDTLDGYVAPSHQQQGREISLRRAIAFDAALGESVLLGLSAEKLGGWQLVSPDISQERSAEQPEGALLLVFKTVLTGFRRCQSVALEKCSSDA